MTRSFERYVQEEEERRDPTLRDKIEQAKRDMFGDDCPGCGAPSGLPPAGPCDNHGATVALRDQGAET